MLLPSLLKSGDQVYQKVIKQLYQKMLLLNLLITVVSYNEFKRPFLYTQNYFILYEFNSDSCANINTFFEITTIFGSLIQ